MNFGFPFECVDCAHRLCSDKVEVTFRGLEKMKVFRDAGVFASSGRFSGHFCISIKLTTDLHDSLSDNALKINKGFNCNSPCALKSFTLQTSRPEVSLRWLCMKQDRTEMIIFH